MPDADLDTDYIKVTLARPADEWPGTPHHLKTYEDRKSSTSMARRSCSTGRSARRNKVVLPAGYEVVGLTVPSQIITEADGRIGISFVDGTEGEAPLRAPRGEGCSGPARRRRRRRPRGGASWESPFEGATEEDRLAERAHQDRDIVYFLRPPQSARVSTSTASYTESRPGVNGYANVVRAEQRGQLVRSARILDAGWEPLEAAGDRAAPRWPR